MKVSSPHFFSMLSKLSYPNGSCCSPPLPRTRRQVERLPWRLRIFPLQTRNLKTLVFWHLESTISNQSGASQDITKKIGNSSGQAFSASQQPLADNTGRLIVTWVSCNLLWNQSCCCLCWRLSTQTPAQRFHLLLMTETQLKESRVTGFTLNRAQQRCSAAPSSLLYQRCHFSCL